MQKDVFQANTKNIYILAYTLDIINFPHLAALVLYPILFVFFKETVFVKETKPERRSYQK